MAKNFFGNLSANVLNMLGGMAAGAIVSLIGNGISWIYKQISGKAAEEAKQKIEELAETAKSEFKSVKDELDSTKGKVDEVSKKYAELAQNVGKLGTLNQNQGSLSNDDYQEFLDISNELAELFPSLTIGYDENGNAILDLNGDVQTITSSLYDMVDAQKALANQDLADKMPDIYSGFRVKQNDYANDYNKLLSEKRRLDEIYQELVQDKNGVYYILRDNFTYKDLENMLPWLSEDDTFDVSLTFSELTKEQQQIIGDYFSKLSNEYFNDEYFKQLSTLEKNIASKNKDFSFYTLSLIQTNSTYSELSSEKQKIVNSVLTNMGYDTVLAGYDDDWEEAYSTEIEDNLLNAIRDIDDTKVIDALINVLSGDISKADFDKYTQIIQDYDANNELIDFSKWFKPDDSEIVKEAKAAKERIVSVLGKKDIIGTSIIDFFVNTLTPEELNVLDNLEINDNLIKTFTEDGAIKFVESLYQQIQDQLKSKELELELDVPTKIDTASAADSAKDAFDALNKALADYEKNGIKGMDINNLIALNNEDTFGNINGSTASLESFLAVMQNVNSTSTEVQEAFDQLATDYVYHSELAEKITEDNIAWITTELEKNGIINASVVAEQMLIDKLGAEATVINECIHANLSLNKVKLTAENATEVLANATVSEIDQLIGEANAAGIAINGLADYVIEKISATNTQINTDGDIKNLMALADNLGGVGQLLEQLIELKAAFNSQSNATAKNEIQKNISQLEAEIKAKMKAGANANTSSNGAYKTSSSGSGASNSDPSEEIIDWVEIGIKRCQEAIARLDKVVGDTYDNWYNRNVALYDEMSKVTKEIEYQQNAYSRYIQEADSIGLSSDYVDKIQNGRLDIETVTDETLRQQISDYTQWYDKAINASDAIKDLELNLSKLAEQSFSNVKSEYEGLISLIESSASHIDEKINNIEEHGYFISANYYTQLANLEQNKINNLNTEYSELQKKLSEAINSGAIEEGSEAWISMQKDIMSVEQALAKSNTALVKFSNNIRDLNWEIFDYTEDRINQITQEAEFLINLLDRDKLYENNGLLNAQGMSTMGLHGINYNTYMQQSVDYANELKNIDKDLAKDPYNKELIARREELLKLQQESISNAESEKEAIKSLVQEGINIHLDSLSTLIDKYKESLSRAKDLYDYQKNIAEQTKNIADLEKTLMAYANDDSEVTRKIVQQTEVSLQEAKDKLQETQWDRFISETEKLLDDFFNDYSEILNARLDDTNALINDMLDSINNNSDIIKNTIIDETEKVSYNITDNLKTTLNTNSNLVSDFKNAFVNNSASILESINIIKDIVAKMTNAKTTDSTPKNSISPKSVKSSTTTSNSNISNNTSSNKNTSSNNNGTGNGKVTLGEKVILLAKKKYYENSYGGGRYGYASNDKQVYITYLNPGSPYPYHLSTGNKIGNGDLGWVKLDEIKGYYRGGKNINEPFVWTQEKGTEYIRTKDGAILTPNADMVFNNKASETLFEFANNPSQFITSLKVPTNIPKSNINSVINNDNTINVTLPNVQNYSEFKQQLQKDNNFQSFIQDVTIGQMLGKRKFNKNKYM